MERMDAGSVEERVVRGEERGARSEGRGRAPRRGGSAGALLLAGALVAGAPIAAQVPAAPQSRPVALVGGTLHPVSGAPIPNGTIVFEGGKITALGAGVAVPAGAERIDITGRHVYPGLVDAYSHVGLWEIGSVDMTVDLTELGRINPNVRAEVAVNPESRHIGIARSGGVLTTLASPEGGLISGMAAAMALEGWTWEEMTLKGGAALIVQWPSPLAAPSWGGGGGARQADPEARYQREIGELRDAFAAARAYRTAHAATPARGARPPATDARWAAMVPVLEGRVPVIVEANELRQIQDAITWAEAEGVRLVVRGARDAGYVADHLARKQVPVLLTAVLDAPSRQWEPYDAVYSLPARLHAAGVRFAITGSANAAYAYRLPQEAGAAIAFGLPAEAALRAVTLTPAQMLGIDDRVGSLEVGKDATLLITTGNPLEYSTLVEQAYVGGRRADMRDVQRQLYEKYRERNRQAAGAAAAGGR